MAHLDNNTNCRDNGYTLGEWQVFPKTGILVKGGHHTHAEPKVMQVLECLIMANGKMVTRDELIKRVWPRVVVNEEVLTRAISELRTLLGDVSRERRYIITIPKRGYKLVMPATPLAAPAGKPGLFPALLDPIRQLLDKPATAYVAVPMLALSLWMNATNMGNDTNGNTTNSGIAHDTFSPFASPLLVMPLAVITDDELTHTFAAGLTQDLQHAVFQQTNLQIVQQLDAQPLQTELILSGTVRIYDQLARVNLQLVAAQSSSVLWSSSFECDLDAPLPLQERIARQVGKKLQQSFNTYI